MCCLDDRHRGHAPSHTRPAYAGQNVEGGLPPMRPVLTTMDYQSSFFINPANAANGLCVALAIVGLLVEPSPKYCWSV